MFLAASRQHARYDCIEATISMWLHHAHLLVVAASMQHFRYGCIELSPFLWLHQVYNFVVAATNDPLRYVCIEATISLHRDTILFWLHR